MLTFLAAWPPVAECRLCVTGYDLTGRAASLHASPKGDFPQPPARRLPRHGALGRAPEPIRRWPIHRQHRSTVPLCFTDLLWKSGGKAAENRKPCPSLRNRHPVLDGLAPSAFFRSIVSDGQSLFSLSRRDFTSTVQGLLARSSLRSTLSRYGFISLGFSKKYSVGYEVSCFAACAISMSSTVAKIRSC